MENARTQMQQSWLVILFYHTWIAFLLFFVLMDAPFLLHVIKLLEEMKAHGVKLKGETYICLLNALAATGRTDQV